MNITGPIDMRSQEDRGKNRGVVIIIPLYRKSELIPDLIQSCLECSVELKTLPARLIFINDSPEDHALKGALERYLPKLGSLAELQVNEKNVGFIKSCNIGLRRALELGEDALLLNSDALLTPGALTEMVAVSSIDPMIGFVSPRSNNATICNSPYPDRFRSLSLVEALAAHQEIECMLPRLSYVPTAVGFCLLIKNLMLAELGLLDEIYGHGYNEENDFIMRCNRRGYRSVLANHAFVHHIGSASFALMERPATELEKENRKVLLERFPEYETSVVRFFNGTEYQAQWLIAGLVKDESGRQRVLFECSHVGLYYNGTFELVVHIVRDFVQRHGYRYECSVSCNYAAYRFHGLHQIQGLLYAGTRPQAMATGPYMAVIRLAQPFSLQDIVDIVPLAPISGFLILDTIAMDCQNLDSPNLTTIWNQMLRSTALIGFISEFSREQFHRRFHVPQNMSESVILLSTNVENYETHKETPSRVSTSSALDERSGYVLLVGNHFAHKNVRETVELLRLTPNCPSLVVLGMAFPPEDGIISFQAGELDDDLVQRLYRQSGLVLFPSHYEGFGLPIMHALAHRKPVIARDLPVAKEIKERTRYHKNLHLLPTTAAMVNMARTRVDWVVDDAPSALPEQSWADAADSLERSLVEAKQRFQFTDLFRRIESVNACKAMINAP